MIIMTHKAITFSSKRLRSIGSSFLISLAAIFIVGDVNAQTSEQIGQAKRIHERLTGVAPSSAVLDDMVAEIGGTDSNGDGITGGEGAAQIAMDNDNFYRVTIKNWVTPWTNRDQSMFAPLNDYTATVMGYIRDKTDFREILSGSILYRAQAGTAGVTANYSATDNNHYEQLEDTDPQTVRFSDVLQVMDQNEANTGVPQSAAAGVMTSRAAAQAFFVDGTNRAMLRYTMMNHMCVDLEQVQDATLSPDRIRQDVSRSPGGDSRVFTNTCATCHSGMDPLAQAFAYYDFVNEPERNPTNFLEYVPEGATEPYGDFDVPINVAVNPKYHINDTTFILGYRTPDDQWENYWRQGVNQFLGWNESMPSKGKGAASMGAELANSDAFAQCQVKKVFETVCLREPSTADNNASGGYAQMVSNFKTGYNLKQTFAEVANYCKGG